MIRGGGRLLIGFNPIYENRECIDLAEAMSNIEIRVGLINSLIEVPIN